MEQEKPMLISDAASEIDVKPEVILGWVESGKVKMFHPNYVLMSDVRKAYVGLRNSREHTFLPQKEDRNGFRLLGKE